LNIKKIVVVVLSIFVSFISGIAFTQDSSYLGKITGLVRTHADHSMLAGAHIEIRSNDALDPISVTSDQSGSFSIPLPRKMHAPFALTVQVPGFQQTHLTLNRLPSDGAILEVELDIDSVNSTVTVSGESQPLVQDSPVISQLIDGHALDTLPENGRNLSKLSLLDPQVRNTSGLGSDAINGARLNVNADIFRLTITEAMGPGGSPGRQRSVYRRSLRKFPNSNFKQPSALVLAPPRELGF